MIPLSVLTRRRLTLGTMILAGATGAVSAAAASAPSLGTRETLRELTTDRPDATESPFTVDPGHVQLEMDVASYTRDRLDGVKTTEWRVAPFNLRYGLTPTTEIGVFVAPYVHVTEQPRGAAKTSLRGMGDTVIRTKVNLWGNDGGPTAFGVFADLKVPTAKTGLGNDKVEGALTLPAAFELGGGWAGGAMTSVEFLSTDRGRRPVWVNTITFARELANDLGGFLELTSAAGDGAHVATFNCGLTRQLARNLQLDGGVNIGLSRTAPDLTVFAGISRKY